MVRTMKRTAFAVLALLIVGFAAQTVLAVEGAGGPRGSALIFPYYNQTTGYRTFVRVTNAVPANSFGVPDMALHNMYLEAVPDATGKTVCREFNRFRPITANDAEIWDLRSEAPVVTRGFFLTYVVNRTNAGGIITFGGQMGFDTLFGESVILNTTEGWIEAVKGIPVGWDPSAAQPFLNIVDPEYVLAQAEGISFGAAGWFTGDDGNAIDYHFQTFGNDFAINFFNPKLAIDPTDVVILPFSLFDIAGVRSWAQPRENFDGNTNQWTYYGNWFDSDETQHNVPPGRINCWGFKSVDDLTLGGASTSPTGYGWVNIATDPLFGGYIAGSQVAVLYQLEDPVPNAGYGWSFYTPRRADGFSLAGTDGGPFSLPYGFVAWPAGWAVDNGGKTTIERIDF